MDWLTQLRPFQSAHLTRLPLVANNVFCGVVIFTDNLEFFHVEAAFLKLPHGLLCFRVRMKNCDG